MTFVAVGCSSTKSSNNAQSATTAAPAGSSPGATSAGSSPGATTAGNSSAAAPTGTPIPIGTIETQTGGAGTTANTTLGVDTVKVWVEWTNAHGGVNGHPVKLYSANDNADPAQAQAALNNMIHNDHIIALVGQDAAATQPTWDKLLSDAGVPVIGGSSFTTDYNTNPDLYATMTTVETAVYGGEYAVKQAGFTKQALLQCNNESVCVAAVPLIKLGAKALGIDMVYSQTANALATDYTAQCLAMKSSGAQVVEASVNQQLLAANCHQQGYNPVYVTDDQGFTIASLKATPAFEGAIGFLQAFPNRQEFPQTSEYFDAMNKYAPQYMAGGSKHDQNVALISSGAWSGAYVFGEALQNVAIPASQTVTTADVKKGLSMIPQGSTNHYFTPPVYYGNGTTVPEKAVNCFWINKVVNADYKLIGDISSVTTQCEPTSLLHFK